VVSPLLLNFALHGMEPLRPVTGLCWGPFEFSVMSAPWGKRRLTDAAPPRPDNTGAVSSSPLRDVGRRHQTWGHDMVHEISPLLEDVRHRGPRGSHEMVHPVTNYPDQPAKRRFDQIAPLGQV
jgi:hypothetical protein